MKIAKIIGLPLLMVISTASIADNCATFTVKNTGPATTILRVVSEFGGIFKRYSEAHSLKTGHSFTYTVTDTVSNCSGGYHVEKCNSTDVDICSSDAHQVGQGCSIPDTKANFQIHVQVPCYSGSSGCTQWKPIYMGTKCPKP